jgi:hypothetical protein
VGLRKKAGCRDETRRDAETGGGTEDGEEGNEKSGETGARGSVEKDITGVNCSRLRRRRTRKTYRREEAMSQAPSFSSCLPGSKQQSFRV